MYRFDLTGRLFYRDRRWDSYLTGDRLWQSRLFALLQWSSSLASVLFPGHGVIPCIELLARSIARTLRSTLRASSLRSPLIHPSFVVTVFITDMASVITVFEALASHKYLDSHGWWSLLLSMVQLLDSPTSLHTAPSYVRPHPSV